MTVKTMGRITLVAGRSFDQQIKEWVLALTRGASCARWTTACSTTSASPARRSSARPQSRSGRREPKRGRGAPATHPGMLTS